MFFSKFQKAELNRYKEWDFAKNSVLRPTELSKFSKQPSNFEICDLETNTHTHARS